MLPKRLIMLACNERCSRTDPRRSAEKKCIAATASAGISTRHENLIDKYPLDSQTCKLQKML